MSYEAALEKGWEDLSKLFDKSITQIFCTEDIVVLAGFVASQL